MSSLVDRQSVRYSNDALGSLTTRNFCAFNTRETIRGTYVMLVIIWTLAVFCIALAGCTRSKGTNQTPALMGTVRSAEDGTMEGVLVTAKRQGSPIAITVVSDEKGRYEFPADHLAHGNYHISIRAAGYELQSPGAMAIASGKSAQVDLQLIKTADVASQLMSAEWLMSVPGTQEEKSALYRCVSCHDLLPVVQSHYDLKSWPATLARMQRWVPPSVLSSPIVSPTPPDPQAADLKFVSYLDSINLHENTVWPFPLRTLARPSGSATRVIITEYDLPGPSLPHDAAVGHDGFIWYNDFQRALIGRLDPRTGQTKEWPLPILRPGFPEGLLTIKVDKDGNVWIPRFFQGCTLTRFDTKTEQFTNWTVPRQYNTNESRCAHVALGAPDGTVWMSDSGGRRMFKLDPRTGHFDAYDSFPGYAVDKSSPAIETAGRRSRGHRTYGIGVDSVGNGYFADIAGSTIGEIDFRTGKVTLYPTLTPDSGPRRTYMDSKDRYWFGENYASKLGMFDVRTKKMQEWVPPIPWSGLYPAVVDKNGEVWSVGMSTDFVYRFEPGTGTFTEYLLPTLGANLRRVDADNSTTPVTIWTAEVHRGKLAKIEPLK
jgi:virginiamycin B lyase